MVSRLRLSGSCVSRYHASLLIALEKAAKLMEMSSAFSNASWDPGHRAHVRSGWSAAKESMVSSIVRLPQDKSSSSYLIMLLKSDSEVT